MKYRISKYLLLLVSMFTSLTASADVEINATNFPDSYFRNWIFNNVSGASDGTLTNSELAKVTSISCRYKGTHVRGIEFFTALKELTFTRSYSSVLYLDVSRNTALTNLSCSDNQIITLDVNKNTALTNLNCSNNKLTSLDVSNNKALTHLYCNNNQLLCLDLSNNTSLTYASINSQAISIAALDCSEGIGIPVPSGFDFSKVSNLKFAGNAITGRIANINGKKYLIFAEAGTQANTIEGKQLTYTYSTGNSKAATMSVSISISKVGEVQQYYVRFYSPDGMDMEDVPSIYARDRNGNENTYQVSEYGGGLYVEAGSMVRFIPPQFPASFGISDIFINGAVVGTWRGDNFSYYEECEIDSLACDTEVRFYTRLDSQNSTCHAISHGPGNVEMYKNGKYIGITSHHVYDYEYNIISQVFEDGDVMKLVFIPDDYAAFSSLVGSEHGTMYDPAEDFTSKVHNNVYTVDVFWDYDSELIGSDDHPIRSFEAFFVPTLTSTFFPDDNFRSCISSITGVAEGDAISEESLKAITTLDVSNKGIKSLEGIEFFTALEKLYCQQNQLTSLDVLKNLNLTTLDCSHNQLTSLNVGYLWNLNCSFNQLTSLDVSENTALTSLDCYSNQLTALDVSKNTALTGLNCGENQLTSLDVSKNTGLTSLACDNNQLTSLDVSKNTALISLGCYSNQLTSLDVSKNTALNELYCMYNQLTSLYVRGVIPTIDCSNNQLLCLDLAGDRDDYYVWVISPQELSIKAVDIDDGIAIPVPSNFDVFRARYMQFDGEDIWSTASTVTIDNQNYLVFAPKGTAASPINGKELTYTYRAGGSNMSPLGMGVTITLSYTPTTPTGIEVNATNFPDEAFRSWVLQNVSGASDRILTDEEIANVTSIDCSDKDITSLQGIEHFTALTSLSCYSNQLTSLDLRKNTALKNLNCYGNKLTNLDVSKNTALTDLYCPFNQLTTLDVSNNTKLTFLGCDNNQLTTLDVSKNTALNHLVCSYNQLLYLNLVGKEILDEKSIITPQTTALTATNVSEGIAIPVPTDFDFTKISNLKLAGANINGSITNVDSQKYLVFAQPNTAQSSIDGKKLTYTYSTGNKYSPASSMDVTVTLSYTATTYSLSIQSGLGGSVSYDGTTVTNTTRSFTVNEGTSATITITPNSGYRLSRLTVNGTNVTSSVSNNQYTISNITANTTVVATFEQIPATTYSLSIQSGNGGSVSYEGTTITNKTQSFTVNEGTSATITITPNTGYKLSKLTVNGTNVTSSVKDNKYTISSISGNTTVVATFEQITYTLSVQATGNGTVTYNNTATKNKTNSFTVNHGASATLSISPDNGYRLASLTVNGTNVTSSVSNNQYTISNITANTTVVVTFEQIPVTTYSLSIQSGAGGSVFYDGTTITNKTQSFTVAEGSSVTIEMTPDSGYKLESLTVNGTDVTSGVKDNSYTISNISANTNVVATFSVITYTLSIQATGSGTVTYGSNTISNTTRNYSVNYGSSATLTFKASSGYELGNLTVGGVDVTTAIINNSYTVSNITSNTSVVATFYALASSFTSDGISYGVTSFDDLTLLVKSGTYSGHLVIPSMVTHDGKTWQVTGIESGAFKNCTGLISIQIPSSCESIGNSIFEGCTGLAAVTWEPQFSLTGEMFGNITNPNLLLFTTKVSYAPYGINNVVVNGEASEITLTDVASGNNFYCPKAFKAKTISYTHEYSMTTGRGNSQGWETIALPFDVTTITHKTDVKLKPFSSWTQSSSDRPFWLYRLTSSGWTAEKQIKANTPYIISMPNNTAYQAGYIISGQVTFSAENATVAATSAVNTSSNGSKQFVPNFTEQTSGGSIYAINANNALGSYAGSYTEGSVFTNSPARTVHPFEAYTNSTNNAKAFIPIFDSTPTGISILLGEECSNFRIYSLAGQLVRDCRNTTYEEAIRGLATGVYLVNGKKLNVKP